MDEQIITLIQQLQARIDQLDAHADHETLQWAYDFLRELIGRIEIAAPALKAKRLRQELDEATRIINELTSKMGIERELDGEEPPIAGPGVPVRRKPGPKGLNGGVALPLP
jgi:hypothetical protein